MAVLSDITQVATGVAVDAALALFKPRTTRSIGGDAAKGIKPPIIAPCVVREGHMDDFRITSHPVEFGAPISDHTFAEPKRLQMEIIYSESGNFSALKTAASLVGIQSAQNKTLKEYYQQFFDLQANNQAFDIVTGKRTYKNMLIENITCETTTESENLLKLNIDFLEVIIVRATLTTDTTNAKAPELVEPPVTLGSIATKIMDNATDLVQPYLDVIGI